VPPHEVGHYVGLDHKGHVSPGEIMWKPNQKDETGDDNDWVSGVANYLLGSGEANFTMADAEVTWQWITTTEEARDTILP